MKPRVLNIGVSIVILALTTGCSGLSELLKLPSEEGQRTYWWERLFRSRCSEPDCQESVVLEFSTKLSGDRACEAYYNVVFGLKEDDISAFVAPGAEIVADSIGAAPNAKMWFSGVSLKLAQEALVARAHDPENWLHNFVDTHAGLYDPRIFACNPVGWRSCLDSTKIDVNDNPIIRVQFLFTPTSAAMAGEDPGARLLLGTVKGEQARFEASGEYLLRFDPPYFRHTVLLDIKGFAGSTKLLPANLHPVFVTPRRAADWRAYIGKQIVAEYNKQFAIAARTGRHDLFGASTIQRYTIINRRRQKEIKELAGHCYDAFRDAR